MPVRTLAEWGQFLDPEKKGVANIIELLDQDNAILDDIKWMEGNEMNGNTTTIRTGLPKPTWRKLYKGVPPSKSKVGKVTDTCGMMEDRSEIDKDLYVLNGASTEYRLQESRAHTEGMNQELATMVFYGDTNTHPERFMGLAPRYAFKDAPNVVDAGGTGNACTSIWLVVWGDDAACGIFPKGSKAGLEHQDLGEYDAFDGDGNRFRAVGDLYKWKPGLTIKDWRCIVRIANIDTDNITAADLQKLMIQAKNKIPAAKRARAIWYCNETVMTALEIASTDKNNVHLRYGEYLDSKEILKAHGKPVRQCDAILNTEAALSAMPA
ncbi:major capsid protein [Marinobacterium jannaschii]|uniref:major capsid protein n=1 Tax=Marinobacterium jannaschii TaxID=64970 RepID=UPI000489015F|nr:hypothetical protein [Marinobacterium jannaschii]